MISKGTPDAPLAAHEVREERARVAGDVDAGQRSAFVRPFIPYGEVLSVPPRHQIVVAERFALDAGARLVLNEQARLVVLGDHVVTIPTVVDRIPILAFNSASMSASGFLLISGIAMQAGLGYVMARPGRVVAASFALNCTTATSPGSLLLRVRRTTAAGVTSDVFSISKTITSTGIKTAYLSVPSAQGVPFVEGDVLTLYMEWGTFVGAVDDIFAHALLELT